MTGPDRNQERIQLLGVAAGAVTIGAGAYTAPLFAVAVAAPLLLLMAAAVWPDLLPRVFGYLLAVVLIGYAFGGRPFAYIGAAPLFIGEVCLALGVVCVAAHPRRAEIARSPLAWGLLLFMIWGALQTVPYYQQYGLDALRDGVLWGYGVAALLVIPILQQPARLRTAADGFGALAPLFLIWVVVHALLSIALGVEWFPVMPGTNISILAAKAGDFGVHLAGVAAFLLLGMHQDARPGALRLRAEWLLWPAWLAAMAVVATRNRGAIVAMAAAVAVVLVLRGIPLRRLAVAGSAAVVMLLAALVAEVSVNRGEGVSREISVEQMVTNVTSIWSEESNRRNDGTREWRLDWWSEIVNYTFHGAYFWTGKGFGINLATDDGFQVLDDDALRSPHNGHMTILARAGVPGFAIWVALQVGFAVSLLFAALRSRRLGQDWWARFFVWILAYWAAFMANASFDVYLEGPQGGIPFWVLFGTGLAGLRAQRQLAIAPRSGELGIATIAQPRFSLAPTSASSLTSGRLHRRMHPAHGSQIQIPRIRTGTDESSAY